MQTRDEAVGQRVRAAGVLLLLLLAAFAVFYAGIGGLSVSLIASRFSESTDTQPIEQYSLTDRRHAPLPKGCHPVPWWMQTRIDKAVNEAMAKQVPSPPSPNRVRLPGKIPVPGLELVQFGAITTRKSTEAVEVGACWDDDASRWLQMWPDRLTIRLYAMQIGLTSLEAEDVFRCMRTPHIHTVL